MPELPEVETVTRGLQRLVAGRTITGVDVAWAKTVQSPDASTVAVALVGRTIVNAHRRAKYILLDLDDGTCMSIHLRMTGRLFVLPAGSDAGKHTRVTWTFDNGEALYFVDPRKFGRVALLTAPDLAALYSKLGPEPLEEFSPAILGERLRRRKSAIKSVLLDQSVVAGLGNIYADETLFLARIHPQRLANSLSPEELAHLSAAIQTVLATAVDRQGTTLSDEQFRGVEGGKGSNQDYLAVFRRTGQPCFVCSTAIERIRLGGRSTHFCPHCQV